VSRLRAWVELARVDQWLKNASVLPGAIVATQFSPALDAGDIARIGLVLVAACLLSSSSYVLNGLLDAVTDRAHPIKQDRPLVTGSVTRASAWCEWAVLGAAGLALAWSVNPAVGWTATAFVAAALAYNAPPLRTKDLPYLDIVVEAINNPLRLALGWFAVVENRFPPLSLLLAYWTLGAFLLTVKRLAELRFLTSRKVAAPSYRRSFAHYSEARLHAGTAFHLVLCSFFAGVFIVRFKLELILMLPAGALFVAWYLWLGLDDASPAQSPERVFRRPLLAGYLAACLLLFLVLLRSDIPALYRVFNVEPASGRALWELDRGH
jgi:decaprenyl-phosphate phosphoribosyltransferase